MIPTRWLVLSMVTAVVAIGALAYWDERQRPEAGLDDLGVEQASVAEAAGLAVSDTARARDAELERVSRSATMAARGSGIAHELSTPLGVIVGRAEQLLARAGGDERQIKNAQTILDQADHIDRVVRGLLELARGLAIANEIASTHRGSLAIGPLSPRGTRACVTIPIDGGARG